jgi:hypothetical protein
MEPESVVGMRVRDEYVRIALHAARCHWVENESSVISGNDEAAEPADLTFFHLSFHSQRRLRF